MKLTSYVYVYFRPSGEPCYVGKGSTKTRWREHLKQSGSCNPRLTRIIAKAGGSLPHLKIRDGLTDEEAIKCEIALIAAIGRGRNGPLVNMTDGGDGTSGRIHSPRTRANISAARKGAVITLEHREKLRLITLARVFSPEEKAKISAKIRAAKIGKPNPISAETRIRMRAAHIGKKHPPETREKMSKAKQGKTPWAAVYASAKKRASRQF